MQEAFLHFIWKYRKCGSSQLELVSGQTLTILHPGQHNQLAGPDFLDARIRIDQTLWAGHVEIHVKASDWYTHQHERDPAYENVILHVVWDNNLSVIGKDELPIPTLELQYFVPQELHPSYEELLRRRTVFIPCEKEVSTVEPMVVRSWLDRMYLERLQRKVEAIQEDLDRTVGNWEAAFFVQLAMGFGTKINKKAFAALARQIPYHVICKSRSGIQTLEALFMGMGGLLRSNECADPYLIQLRREFEFLSQKFDLKPRIQERIHFFKLRPMNFPTIRLSQLAGLYHQHPRLLTRCIGTNSIGELHHLFQIAASTYWETHYTFGNPSPSRKKVTSHTFINTILINVVLPFKYAYWRSRGRDPWEEVMHLIRQLPAENNSIICRFRKLGILAPSAMDTQALLELHTFYCRSKRCLDCSIGHRLLGRK